MEDNDVNLHTEFSIVMECIASNDLNRIFSNKKSLLINLIYSNNTALVDVVLENGADPNFEPIPYLNPLMLASFKGYDKIVGSLIKHDANINATNEFGVTVLMSALKYSTPKCIELILKANPNIHLYCNDGNNALIYAAYRGDMKFIGTLIKKGANINHRNNEGISAFWVVSYHRIIDAIGILADLGAEVNISNKEGFTPLINAIKNQDINTIRFLISKKADLYTRTPDGIMPVHFAIMTGNVMILSIFEKYHPRKDFHNILKVPSLISLIYSKKANVDSIKYLVHLGCDVNQVIYSYELSITPLIIAISKDEFIIAQTLLELGANPNLGVEQFPLDYAIEKANENDFRYVDLLRSYGVV